MNKECNCNCDTVSSINIQISKIRNVKTPARANTSDAGIDFFVPEYSTEFMEELIFKNSWINSSSITYEENRETGAPLMTGILIPAKTSINIPSGIHVNFPDGYALVAFEKSGVATKKKLVCGARVVDAGYMGQVHLSLINTSDEWVEIRFGEKIVQFILLPIPSANIQVKENLDELYLGRNSTRGAGGFGSSGTR